LGELLPEEQIHKTKCGHEFHKECFDTLENTYRNATLKCPMCNTVLRTPKFTSDLINKEINEYKEEWGELDCDDLIKQIDLTYGKTFEIDKDEIHIECEKNITKGGKKNTTKKIRNKIQNKIHSNNKKTYKKKTNRKKHVSCKKKSIKRIKTRRYKKRF
jgi:hypothetical protein